MIFDDAIGWTGVGVDDDSTQIFTFCFPEFRKTLVSKLTSPSGILLPVEAAPTVRTEPAQSES